MEFLLYKEGDRFVAVCLTFDLVEEGSDPVELMHSIKEAAELHIETVIKNDMPEDLLNRYAPEAYWEKYFKAAKALDKGAGARSGFLTLSPYSSGVVPQVA